MKKSNYLTVLAITIILVQGMNTLFAQDIKVGHFYKIKSGIVHALPECDANGTNPAGFISKSPPGGSKFTIVNKLATGDYVIKFWAWGSVPAVANPIINAIYVDPTNATQTGKALTFNYWYNGTTWEIRYFKITASELELYTTELESFLVPTVGTAVMPFKFRQSKGDFSKDLTISNLAGVKHNFTDNFGISALLGIGISSVKLDSINTNNTIKKSSDFAALTLSSGLVFEYKRLQFGAFIGWDHLTSSDHNNWVYQGKYWLAVGIGYSLFSETSAKSKETGN